MGWLVGGLDWGFGFGGWLLWLVGVVFGWCGFGVGVLVDGLVGSLVARFVWLFWPVGGCVGSLVARFVWLFWPVGWCVGWLVCWLGGWLVGSLDARFVWLFWPLS